MSFKRAETSTSASAPAPAGSRRWLDGQCLVSTGHSALDAALGGGVPLGSLVLIEEDVCGGHGSLLAGLFAAEGLACGHCVCVAGGDGRLTPRSFLEALPLCVSRGSADMAALAAVAAGAGAGAGSVEGMEEEAGGEAEGEEEQDVSGAGLQNAWQYKKYLPSEGGSAPGSGSAAGAGGSGGYCHTFDLGRRIPAASLARGTARVLEPLPTPLAVPSGAQELLAKAQLILARGLAESGGGQREEEGATLAACAAALQQGLLGSPAAAFYAGLSAALAAALQGSSAAQGPAPPAAAAAATAPVTRLVVLGLGGPGWPGCTGNSAIRSPTATGSGVPVPPTSASTLPPHLPMLSACSALRRALSAHSGRAAGAGAAGAGGSTPAIALLTAPTWAMPSAVAAALRSKCDLVIKVHGFKDPGYGQWMAGGVAGSPPWQALAPSPAFKGATGLLLLRRLPRWACATPPALPDTLQWLFKRSRRRLVVERPHQPPEEESKEGGEGGGGLDLGCASAGGSGGAEHKF